MDFLQFGLFYLIYTIILFLIFIIVRKFLFKKACYSVSKEIENSLDDYFNSYDKNLEIIEDIDYNEKRVL